jgi:hypothetical protein
LLGPPCPVKSGPPAPADIAVQRELTDRQHLAPGFLNRQVHLPGFIFKDPQAGHLLGDVVGRLRGIFLRNAQEHHVALADGTDHLAVHRHPASGDPLNHRSHRLAP